MRIPVAAHTDQPWRIHEITPDFRVQDVWALSTPGAGPDDLAVMLAAMRADDERDQGPFLVRLLFAVRWKLGEIFGWDEPEQGIVKGGRAGSLCDRLPRDLRQPATGTPEPNSPFTQMYELRDECALEVANKTVHGVAHYGWVSTDTGEYELRLAILVKANGLLGRVYMAAIAPFRHVIVYPAMTRQWERAWQDRTDLLGDSPGKPN